MTGLFRRCVLLSASLACLAYAGSHARAQEAIAEETTVAVSSQVAAPPMSAMMSAQRAKAKPPKPVQRTIAGKVVLPDGNPAAGALIAINRLSIYSQPEFIEVAADATGRFARSITFDSQKHSPIVTVAACVPGKGVVWNQWNLNDKGLKAVTLKLDAPTKIAGRLVDLNGRPIADQKIALSKAATGFERRFGRSAETDGAAFDPSKRVQADWMPPSWRTRMYSAASNADGRFELKGLPATGQVSLKLSDGRILAPRGHEPLMLAKTGVNAGILVGVKPGSLTVKLVDQDTGKPATGVNTMLLPKSIPLFALAQQSDDEGANPLATMPSSVEGEFIAQKLMPGDYRLMVNGKSVDVKIEEGKAASTQLKLRTGSLRCRVVDSAGKPVPNVNVELDAKPNPLAELSQGFGGAFSRAGRSVRPTMRLGFAELTQFPWGAEQITLRARHGNDMAEWTGPAASLPHMMELKLKKNFLVSVSGRLVTPHRKPLPKMNVSVIRWQDAPRLTWFSNATQCEVGADGHFKIDGMQPGEAFSIISGGNFGGTNGDNDFESPRFMVAGGGGAQDLGDVVIHPLDGAQQILQIYGFESREQLLRLTSIMAPPTQADGDAAKLAFGKYQQAVNAGDVDAAISLTSPRSSGWTNDRKQLLASLSLRTPDLAGLDIEKVSPLRFVSSFSIGYLLTLSQSNGSPFSFNFGSSARELDKHPDWVILTGASSKGFRVAAIMEKSDGQWRVVNAPNLFGQGIEELVLFNFANGGQPSVAGFSQPVPQPDAAQLALARSAGEQFLSAWQKDDDATMLGLTSPLATFSATNLLKFQKARAQRADEGICPASDRGPVKLEPVPGLTRWEQEWLAGYATTITDLTGGRRRGGEQIEAFKNFPAKQVSNGEMVTFRYSGGERDYLMLMVKMGGKWQVLEPALPL